MNKIVEIAVFYGLLGMFNEYDKLLNLVEDLFNYYDISRKVNLSKAMKLIYKIDNITKQNKIKIKRNVVLYMLDQFICDELVHVKYPVKRLSLMNLQLAITEDKDYKNNKITKTDIKYMDKAQEVRDLINRITDEID